MAASDVADGGSGDSEQPPPASAAKDLQENDAKAESFVSNSTTSDELTPQKPQETKRGESPPPKKRKSLPPAASTPEIPSASGTRAATAAKRAKKRNNNTLWTRPTSRKGKKKRKGKVRAAAPPEDCVYIKPLPRISEKNDDSKDMKICLSKVFRGECVELSEDRMCAGSTKGYRMVRATRGVVEGAWYFEIRVLKLGETGHTRLGWSTDKADLQGPVGYDENSFGYRDLDGSKVHMAMREKYGEEGYVEGDVIGFYINLPDGSCYAPKTPNLVLYRGHKFVLLPDVEDPPKIVPGSEIFFFKNGVCQGVAFKDLCGGCYYPSASFYTLPNQPNCMVKFNFGPDFEFFPEDFDNRPAPRPMVEVPYCGFLKRVASSVCYEKKN